MIKTYTINRPTLRSENIHDNLHSSLISFVLCDEVESNDSTSFGPLYTVSAQRKFGRAGVIPYIRKTREYYTSIYSGIDKITGSHVRELSDFGGRVKYSKGENFIQGACRELFEESKNSFDFRRNLYDVIRCGYASWSHDNSMIVIFLPVIETEYGFTIDTSNPYINYAPYISNCRSFYYNPNETAGIKVLSEKSMIQLIEQNNPVLPLYSETKRRIKHVMNYSKFLF